MRTLGVLLALVALLAGAALAAGGLLDQADALLEAGRADQAADLYRKGIPEGEERALNGLATALEQLGRQAEAVPVLERLATLQHDPAARALTLLALSRCAAAADRADRALQAARQARDESGAVADRTVRQALLHGALLSEAALHFRAARWHEALQACLEAEGAGPDAAGRARILSMRALVRFRLGQLDVGAAEAAQAAEGFAAMGDARAQASALDLQARLLADSGQWPEAAAAYAAELALLSGGDAADARVRLGLLQQRMGDPACASTLRTALQDAGLQPESRALALEALGDWKAARDAWQRHLQKVRDNPLLAAGAMEAVARADRALGQLPEAARRFAEAARTSPDDFARGEILGRLALTQADLGQQEQALQTLLQSLDLLERSAAQLPERDLRLSLLDREWERYGLGVDLLAGLGRGPEGFDLAERGRARVFLDSLASLPDPAGVDLVRINAAQADVEAARAALLEGFTPERAAEMRRAQDEWRQALEDLAVSRPEAAELRMVRTVGRDEVRRLLRPDELLVSLFLSPGGVSAWVLTSDGVRFERLPGTAAEVGAEVQALRKAAATAEGPLQPRSGGAVAALLDLLDRAGAGRERLLLVPHGALHYLPFAALDDGHGRWLGERWILTEVPSASSWARMVRREQPPRPDGTMLVLALGSSTPREGLPPLPNTLYEARRVEALFPGAQALREGALTEAEVKRLAPEVRYLHFATHGLLDPRAPGLSSLAMADGYLTAAEVAGMRLQAEVVGLSACDTAMGPVSRGDELVALGRAFLQARAGTVLASLWRVSDEPTADLVVAFYRRLAAGDDPSRALAQAQDAMRRGAWPSPADWAGFVILGSGR